METNDTDLWRQALGGDGEAFGRIFDRTHDRVYRHALRLTRHVHDAEDVVGAAYLELWRRRDAVRLVDGSPVPWLLVTTTNLALNQRRGVRRHLALLGRLPRSTTTTPGADEEALAPASLDVDPALLAQIRGLRRVDQQLLALVALEGFTAREAAAATGLTEAAVRSRWQRLRTALAASWRPEPTSPVLTPCASEGHAS